VARPPPTTGSDNTLTKADGLIGMNHSIICVSSGPLSKLMKGGGDEDSSGAKSAAGVKAATTIEFEMGVVGWRGVSRADPLTVENSADSKTGSNRL
jgi:hypothetical protein